MANTAPAQYRYRPTGNRTPVNDPALGHLCYEGVYDDPRCATDPRFEPIPDKPQPVTPKPKPAAPAAIPETRTPPESRPAAAKTGRS